MAKKRTTRSRKKADETASSKDDFPTLDDLKDPAPKPKRATRKRKPRAKSEAESDESPRRSKSRDDDREPRETRSEKIAKSDRNEKSERSESDQQPSTSEGKSDGERKSDGDNNNNRNRGRNRSGGNNNRSGGGRNSRRRRGGGNNNGGGRNNNNRSKGGNRGRRGGGGGGGGQRRNAEPVEFDDAELAEGVGLLELHPNGYGFLRSPENNYSRERSDPFVPGTMIEKFNLRPGVIIKGMVQPARRQQGPRLRELTEVDGLEPDAYLEVKSFDTLTPINPEQWYQLETGPEPLTTRVMDLLTPLGKGQRALIVAPPRSGKTIMLQHIANGIATNHPGSKLMVLLIDERPEEVTDMKRNVNGEVIASSLDEDIESHVRLSQLVIQRCKRLAEMGQDVFLLMDSITRLARAFNKWVGNTGRTMSGGVDIKAMDIPKKLFSSARAFEEGGSLTIVGTALIDTGSRMDELIFQEFKGTGNMELVLDRKLADRRVWPAIDISQSGTRREELLLNPDTLHAVTMLRRTLTSMHHIEAMEQLTRQLGRFKTNAEFITLISGKMADM
ncbi:MAG: transcription termination factor Rho [Mariniblastus sp.]|nr:transcription termination factor Rho [Mariniblastus sp.]